MSVPKSIAREEEELAALFQEEQAEEPAPDDKEPQETEEAEEEVEQQVEEPAEEIEPEADTSEVGSLRSEIERLNHKFSVLQGKYNSETRQLRETLRSRDNEIAALKSAPAPAQRETPVVQESEPVKNYGIPEEEYDEDIVRLAEKVADAKTRAAMKSLEAKLDEARRVTAAQAEDRFFADLDRLAPGWEELNGEEAWLSWLGTVDRRSGLTYQDMLDDAVNKRDVLRTVSFIEDFQAGKAPKAQRTPSVSSQVVPRSGASTPSSEKGTMSLEEWEAKADSLSKGKHSAASYAKLEAELNAAIKEGRVRM